ncbi:MAG: DoxX family protein [Gemmatimonadaceae bacterium]
MNVALWICQLLLALVFLFSGVTKSTQPVARLVASGQTGVEGLPRGLVCFIGICELFGVAGLVLPWALQTFPVLTPSAAAALGIIMVLAARVHVRRREYRTAAANLVLLTLCVTVAVGRFRAL